MELGCQVWTGLAESPLPKLLAPPPLMVKLDQNIYTYRPSATSPLPIADIDNPTTCLFSISIGRIPPFTLNPLL